MGLFSNKHTYEAFAASSSLFTEEEFPDTFKSEIIQSATIDQRSMAEAVMHTINTDTHARAKQMYRYAARYENPAREGGYIRGLPTSNMTLVSVRTDAVEEALARAVGTYDEIVSYKAGTYEEDFYLYRYIQSVWSGHWDDNQEEITIPGTSITTPNTPVFTRITAPAIPDMEAYRDILGEDAFVKQTTTVENSGIYNIAWPYTDEAGDPATYTLSGDISSYLSGNYLMVRYFVGTDLYYWSYKVGSGVDSILEAAIEENQKDSTFLPVALLMQDKVWFDEKPDGSPDTETELAITTNKLLKRLATSGTEVKEQFIAQQEEDNASKDLKKANTKIWDFLVHFAIPISTKKRGSLEYLWYFFQEMEGWSTHKFDEYYDYLASLSGDRYAKAQPFNELNISESGINGYNVSYRWSYIHTQEFPGEYTYEKNIYTYNPDLGGPYRYLDRTESVVLGPKEVVSARYERTDLGQDPAYQENLDEMFGPGTPVGLWYEDGNGDRNAAHQERVGYHDYFIITRQNPEDPNNPGVPQGYKRTIVMGLSMQYKINTRDTVQSTGKKGYRFRYATPLLFGTDEKTAEFRIPIQWGILRQLPTLHREEACADGLAGTVFMVQTTTVKWYQTGFFKWLLIIIAIILLILSIWFPYLIKAAAATFAAALGGGAILAFIIYVVLIFAIGYMVALGVSLMSPKMQMWFAVIIFIAMLYTGQFSNIKSTFSTFKSAPAWGSAIALFNAVAPIYNMGFQIYSYNEMNKLSAEYEQLLLDQEEQQEILQNARDGFGDVPSWLDPMDLIATYERQGATELADSYYSRVLTTNPGVLGYTMVSDFATIGLMLPKEAGQVSIVEGVFIDFAGQRRQT